MIRADHMAEHGSECDDGPMSEPVLVATHGTPDADAVVRRAATLADAFGAQLHAVSVIQPIDVHAPVGPPGAAKLVEANAALEDQAAAALRRATEIGAAHRCEVVEHVRRGEPAHAIVQLADDIGAGVIVIGSRGLDPAGRYVLGSVPERVLFDAHGHDVFVVRSSPT